MAIESISSVNTGYSVQGSKGSASVSTAAAVTAPEKAAEPNITEAAALQITENSGRESNNSGKEDLNEGRQASSESLQKAVETINKKLGDSKVVFGIHEATNRLTVKMVDKESNKTIKEFPAEETLDMLARIWEMAGILVDERR